jgi:hypothetical protein
VKGEGEAEEGSKKAGEEVEMTRGEKAGVEH